MKLRFYLAALSMIAVTLVVPAALVSAEDPCSVAGYNDESICGHTEPGHALGDDI